MDNNSHFMSSSLMQEILILRGGHFIDSGLGFYNASNGVLVFTIYVKSYYLIEFGVVRDRKFEVIESIVERNHDIAIELSDSLIEKYDDLQLDVSNWIEFDILRGGLVVIKKKPNSE